MSRNRVVAVMPSGCRATFVGEGAANVVFEVLPPPDSPCSFPFDGKLLRMPKEGTHAPDYEAVHEFWTSSVTPLFAADDLMLQELVELRREDDLVSHLNEVLAAQESRRRPDFAGSHVANVGLGMLIEDMRKRNAADVVLEIKPKWLAQSPSAPAAATRCRNCARGAMQDKPLWSTTALKGLCPLDLMLSQRDDVALSRVMACLAADLDPSSRAYARLREWFRTSTLLGRLRDLQQRLDPVGPLSADAEDPPLALAMTLRDCSCFLRVRGDDDEVRPAVEAKLGDLDLKNAAKKAAYWRSTEEKMIAMGYYTEKEEPRQETRCSLARCGQTMVQI